MKAMSDFEEAMLDRATDLLRARDMLHVNAVGGYPPIINSSSIPGFVICAGVGYADKPELTIYTVEELIHWVNNVTGELAMRAFRSVLAQEGSPEDRKEVEEEEPWRHVALAASRVFRGTATAEDWKDLAMFSQDEDIDPEEM